MWACFGAVFRFLYHLIWPPPPPPLPAQPPARAGYGFRWVAGQGVPNALSIYDIAAGPLPAGIYVLFMSGQLSADSDPFGRNGDAPPGPVFNPPGVASAAMNTLINNVRLNPPPDEGDFFNNATAERLADMTGFLTYAANCLDLINATATGAQLLQGIGGQQAGVYISGGGESSQTFTQRNRSVNALTAACGAYLGGQNLPLGTIDDFVRAHYVAQPNVEAMYAQLAADLNAYPLYSLFTAANAGPANWLNTNFSFLGRPMSGDDLLDWIATNEGLPAFDTNLRRYDDLVEGVAVNHYFLFALNLILYPEATPGVGSNSAIQWAVMNAGDNVLGSNEFRPPAIGLAHELVHALHYGRGTAAGFDINHWSTTAAELQFAGIGPFANLPITENAIRAEWANIAIAIDPTNVWAAPVQRLIYEPPPNPQTPTTMRARMHCI